MSFLFKQKYQNWSSKESGKVFNLKNNQSYKVARVEKLRAEAKATYSRITEENYF